MTPYKTLEGLMSRTTIDELAARPEWIKLLDWLERQVRNCR